MEIIEEISKPARINLDKTAERRFIKTHLPFSLLPADLLKVGCKVRKNNTFLSTYVIK